MLQNPSSHLKIITGLSRLPALLNALLPPGLSNKKPPISSTPFTEPKLTQFSVVWGFSLFFPSLWVLRAHLQGFSSLVGRGYGLGA